MLRQHLKYTHILKNITANTSSYVFTTEVKIKNIISIADDPYTPLQFHILPSLRGGRHQPKFGIIHSHPLKKYRCYSMIYNVILQILTLHR